MQVECENAWNPGFRDAVRELHHGENRVVYKTDYDIMLEETAEHKAWIPNENIVYYVQNAHEIDIEFINDTTDLNELAKKFVREGMVGIVLLGKPINRFTVPKLIVLTTSDKFYIIDPTDTNRAMLFLRFKLQDKRVRFYTTNGVNENDCLYHRYGIDLGSSNAICCTGLHLFMMRYLKSITKSRQFIYPPKARFKSFNPRKYRLESYEDLVDIWLGISKEHISYRNQHLEHLTCRPLNQTAINVIKKRCMLVLALAANLEFQSTRDVLDISWQFYKKLRESNKQTREIVTDVINSNDQAKTIDLVIQYLFGAHHLTHFEDQFDGPFL